VAEGRVFVTKSSERAMRTGRWYAPPNGGYAAVLTDGKDEVPSDRRKVPTNPPSVSSSTGGQRDGAPRG